MSRLVQAVCPICRRLYWHLVEHKPETCNRQACLFKTTYGRWPTAHEQMSLVHPQQTNQMKLGR